MSRIYVQSEATAIRRDFPIYLVNSSDGATPVTSQGGSAPQLWVCGSTAWTNCNTNAVEIGTGFYSVRLTAGELGTLGPFAVRYNTAAALEFNMDGVVVAQNIYAPTVAVGCLTATAINSAFANKIADHTLRRTYANARQSSDGDAVAFRSLLGALGKLVNRWAIAGTTLTVYQEDDATSTAPGGTQTLTPSSAAPPISSLDTD